MTQLFKDSGVIDVPACLEPRLIQPAGPMLGEHYREHLLGTERSVSAFQAHLHELLVEACDEAIVNKRESLPGIFTTLGGPEKAVFDTGSYWALLAALPRVGRTAAYVRDANGMLLTVSACWMHGPGWGDGKLWVESGPYNRPYRWGAGCTFATR